MKNNLEILLGCAACGKKNSQSSIRVVSARQNSLLIHSHCSHCESSSLAIISKGAVDQQQGVVSMGVLTDLDYDEACQLLDKEPISIDEVLDVHESQHGLPLCKSDQQAS